MKFREVIKILEDNGWVQKAVRQFGVYSIVW